VHARHISDSIESTLISKLRARRCGHYLKSHWITLYCRNELLCSYKTYCIKARSQILKVGRLEGFGCLLAHLLYAINGKLNNCIADFDGVLHTLRREVDASVTFAVQRTVTAPATTGTTWPFTSWFAFAWSPIGKKMLKSTYRGIWVPGLQPEVVASLTFAVPITVTAPATRGTTWPFTIWVALAWSPIGKRIFSSTSIVWSPVSSLTSGGIRPLGSIKELALSVPRYNLWNRNVIGEIPITKTTDLVQYALDGRPRDWAYFSDAPLPLLDRVLCHAIIDRIKVACCWMGALQDLIHFRKYGHH